MSGSEIKLYLWLLSRARFNPPNKGQVETKAFIIGEFFGWKKTKVYSTLGILERQYIKVKKAKSRHSFLIIEIIKFKAVRDFYSPAPTEGKKSTVPLYTDGNQDGNSEGRPDSNPTVTPQKTNKINGLQTRKKERIKEVKEGNKRGRQTVPKHPFSASPFFDKKVFKENLGVDIHETAFWWHALNDYSEQGNKYFNWLVTARTWKRKAEAKGNNEHRTYRIPTKKTPIKQMVHIEDPEEDMGPPEGFQMPEFLAKKVPKNDESVLKKRKNSLKKRRFEMELDKENPINILCDEIHKANKDKGFWKRENENIGEKLMLVVSELGEAMEAIRKGKRQEYVLPTSEYWEKDTFEDEITDTIIRLFDLCGVAAIVNPCFLALLDSLKVGFIQVVCRIKYKLTKVCHFFPSFFYVLLSLRRRNRKITRRQNYVG